MSEGDNLIPTGVFVSESDNLIPTVVFGVIKFSGKDGRVENVRLEPTEHLYELWRIEKDYERLQAENDQLRGALQSIEWMWTPQSAPCEKCGHEHGENRCPCCERSEENGHHPSCSIGQALNPPTAQEGE